MLICILNFKYFDSESTASPNQSFRNERMLLMMMEYRVRVRVCTSRIRARDTRCVHQQKIAGFDRRSNQQHNKKLHTYINVCVSGFQERVMRVRERIAYDCVCVHVCFFVRVSDSVVKGR